MGRSPHGNWGLRILQSVIALIRARNQTLEVHLVESASTGETISKGVDETNAEPMESRGLKVTAKFKEIYFIRT